MSDSNLQGDAFDELDQEVNVESSFINKRIAVRYRRNDIKAVLKLRSAIFPRLLPAILLDISSKGAAVKCNAKIKKNRKVCLYLLFRDGRRFQIDGIVAHAQTHGALRYGIKFDAFHPELGEHLLTTQTELLFG